MNFLLNLLSHLLVIFTVCVFISCADLTRSLIAENLWDCWREDMISFYFFIGKRFVLVSKNSFNFDQLM